MLWVVKKGHKMIDFPKLSPKGRYSKQASLNGMVPIPPNYGRFYALWSREDKGALLDESIGILIVSYGFECLFKVPLLFS